MPAPRSWDVFCRVIDHHGDLGVAWRLCADLASRGETTRLWVDDASALAWMAPGGQDGVEVVSWHDPPPDLEPGDVVVETFGCDPPSRFVERMAARLPAPAWIDLEYLSAEPYVERSHGLPSPVTLVGGATLLRHFFYPGFTPRTGGLIREPDLLARQSTLDVATWRAAQGLVVSPAELVVSLFCYANPALPALLERLSARPTLLLATPGPATDQVRETLGPGLRLGALRVHCLPWLTQAGYDSLLRACDLNFVRGEDSFVRAQWAGRPFVWQAYPQRDGAHRGKLLAFLDRQLTGAAPEVERALRAWMLAWNGFASLPDALPADIPWRAHCEAWRNGLAAQPDLTTQLLGFVTKMR